MFRAFTHSTAHCVQSLEDAQAKIAQLEAELEDKRRELSEACTEVDRATARAQAAERERESLLNRITELQEAVKAAKGDAEAADARARHAVRGATVADSAPSPCGLTTPPAHRCSGTRDKGSASIQ